MFKEWNVYANLHAFDTNNAGIAEGLISAAIAASIPKRYLGQMTQALRGVEISTRKAAMGARHGLDGLCRALATEKGRGLLPVLTRLVDYLISRRGRQSSDRSGNAVLGSGGGGGRHIPHTVIVRPSWDSSRRKIFSSHGFASLRSKMTRWPAWVPQRSM